MKDRFEEGEIVYSKIVKSCKIVISCVEIEERVLWREMNKNIESGESVCSRASYNYSTLVTIQCLLKVRDFVARFLRATSKMASSAGLFACGQSFWPILHRVTRLVVREDSLSSRILFVTNIFRSSFDSKRISNPILRTLSSGILDYLIMPSPCSFVEIT